MMDATHLIPGGWSYHIPLYVFPTETSPAQRIQVKSRSRVPVKYYFIDFGLSSIFPSFAERKLVVGDIAQNTTVPELSKRVPYDPFALDIRMFGDLIRELQKVRTSECYGVVALTQLRTSSASTSCNLSCNG